MGGLRCGEVSPQAFHAVAPLVDAYIGIDDAWARTRCGGWRVPRVRIHACRRRIRRRRTRRAAGYLGRRGRVRRQGGTRAGGYVQRGGDRQRGRHRSGVVASRGGQLDAPRNGDTRRGEPVRSAHGGDHLAAGRAAAHARGTVRRLAARASGAFRGSRTRSRRRRRWSTPTSSTRNCGRSPTPMRSCCKAWSRHRSSAAARRR